MTANTDAPPPRVRLTPPPGWSTIEVDGALTAAARDAAPGVPPANVVVTHVRRPGGAALEDLSRGALARLRSLPAAELADLAGVTLDGRPGFGARVAFAEPGLGTLVQVVVLLRVPNGAVTDVLELVGTLAGDRVDEDLADVEAVIATARVEG